MCDHAACTCLENSSYGSVHQTLGELEFSRGIWTAALSGQDDEVRHFLDQKGVHPDSLDSSGYTALVRLYVLSRMKTRLDLPVVLYQYSVQ